MMGAPYTLVEPMVIFYTIDSMGQILYFKKDELARVDIYNNPCFVAELGSVDAQLAIKIKESIDMLGLSQKERNNG